jgi:hypothetical protein
MSEVKTEGSKLGVLGSAALLLGTVVAAWYVLPVVVPFVAAHLIGTGIVAAAAGGYVAYDEGRREKAKSFFGKVGGWYQDALSNLRKGWGSATKWAVEREAKAAAAPEAESTSTLGSKEVAPSFKAANDSKVTVKAATPAPASKISAPRPGA